MSQQHCRSRVRLKTISMVCEQMERNAKDGDDAYAYFQLKQMWKQREESELIN